MSPKKGVLSRVAALAGVLALGSIALAALPAAAQSDVFFVNHFDTNGGDGVVRAINPTFTGTTLPNGIVCEMIYVFDAHEELQECCGCPVTNNGLRTISTINDLTKNPLTGPNTPMKTGVIKIVSAAANPSPAWGICNPAGSVSPTETLRAFSTHSYNGGATAGITETEFEEADLSSAELSTLTGTCGFIHTNGTGSGICTCGVGDFAPVPPGAGGR